MAEPYHFVKERIKDGTVALRYVASQDQLADLLTKALGETSFERLRKKTWFKINC